jgi:hypothetical protein
MGRYTECFKDVAACWVRNNNNCDSNLPLPVLLSCAHPWPPEQQLAAVQRMPVLLLAAAAASWMPLQAETLMIRCHTCSSIAWSTASANAAAPTSCLLLLGCSCNLNGAP